MPNSAGLLVPVLRKSVTEANCRSDCGFKSLHVNRVQSAVLGGGTLRASTAEMFRFASGIEIEEHRNTTDVQITTTAATRD